MRQVTLGNERGSWRMVWRFVFERQALLLGLIALLSVASRTSFDAPPRFDGAGYAVLAESLRRGDGYRAIDHPDRPLHAHFPPGYPAVLAALWSVTGPSAPVAHGLSVVCTVLAVVLYVVWMRRHIGPRLSFIVGLALAVNWSWSRAGGAIQSEPLFLLLSALALHAFNWTVKGAGVRGLVLGAVLGVCVLTRHVAVALTAAILLELVLRRKWAAARGTVIALVGTVAPWIWWLAITRDGAQVALFPNAVQLAGVVARQVLFYVERIPDQVTGPLVEVGTVFRPAFRGVAWVWAIVGSMVIVAGWIVCMRRGRWRIVALVPVGTLALLVCWPFTEAGRFLVPLVPFLLIGMTFGLAFVIGNRVKPSARARRIAAILVVGMSLPYSLYALVTQRHRDADRIQRPFDRAMRWIGQQPGSGPVLVRQSGEAFWLMGRSRTALSPADDASDEEIARTIERYGVKFVVVDDSRYVGAMTSLLARYVERHGDRFGAAFQSERVVVSGVRRQ